MSKELEKFDVFISYRRETGREKARNLQLELKCRGYKCFFDYDSVRNGKFDERILDAIQGCAVFCFILTDGSLQRCHEEGDWVRRELLCAIENGKQIVFIAPSDQARTLPDDMPECLASLKNSQISVMSNDDLFEKSVEKIIEDRFGGLVPHGVDDKKRPNQDDAGNVFMTIPARNRGFVGRDQELKDLRGLCGAGRIPLITGPGGVGKTELAYEFAHRYRHEFPGGCFLVPMEKIQSWNDAFRLMLEMASAEGERVWTWLVKGTNWEAEQSILPDKVPELLTIKARSEKVLLVLDNIEDLNLIDAVGIAKAFRYGLPKGVHAIATTRHLTRDFGVEDAVSVFSLDNLSPEAALNLLKAKCPPKNSSELQAARELVEVLDCHAWSVELVASEIALTYRRGGSYKSKLQSLRTDTTLMGHGRSLRKNTEANAIDLLRPTLASIQSGELYGSALIEFAQIVSLFPANGVKPGVMLLIWNKKFAQIAPEIPFRTVLCILREYAILRTEHKDTFWDYSYLSYGQRQIISMHRYTRAALQSSLGENLEEKISEIAEILRAEEAFSIDDWIGLSDDSRLFERCPFDKFKAGEIVNLLTHHPEFASKFDVNHLPSMDRARLFARRPELVDKHSFDGLGSGALWFIAANQPQLVSQMDLNLLTVEDWSFLLCYQPQFGKQCDFSLFTKRDWRRLLCRQSVFADKCNLSIFSESDWTDIIEERPELAAKVNLESFEDGNICRILRSQPRLATKELLGRLDWHKKMRVIEKNIQLLDICATENFRRAEWMDLLGEAEFRGADIAHICEMIKFKNFNSDDLCIFSEMCYHKVHDKPKYGEHVAVELLPMLELVERHVEESFNKFSHAQKIRLAALFPHLFSLMDKNCLTVHNWILAAWLKADVTKDMDFSFFKKEDWIWLLLFRGDLAEKCDFSRFSSDDWAIVLSHNIELIKYCDVSRLDGLFWRVFSHGRYAYDDIVKARPTFEEEYDFSQLDVFLASLANGSFHDSELKMGPEYNLFTRKYVYVWSWYEELATLLGRPLHKAMGCSELYTRVCKCLGPFLPEKFNLALIVDRETIASLARALANRLDGESILRQINWAIVDERTRLEWIENLPEIADMVKQIPAREAHGSFSKANVWTGWHEPMHWDQDYDPTPPIWR